MNWHTLTRTGVAAGTLFGCALSQPVSATTIVASAGEGLYVNLTVAGLINVDLPIGLASGSAPPSYNVTDNLAALNLTTGLTLGSLTSVGTVPVGTNVVADSASSIYPAAPSGTATSTVNGLTTNLGLVGAVVNLLHISATTLTSTSTASAPGGALNLVGASQILDLTVTDGTVGLGGSTVTVNAGALASTPVNDLILSAAGLNVYANYQTPVIDGGIADGINTAAVAIRLNNFTFGTGLLSGTILLADSQASVAGAVPEPATWAMMLFGFGVVGAMARRRPALAPT